MPVHNFMATEIQTHHFLKGGGEMGALTRSYNWSETSLGSIEKWPQSLQTVLGIILHSDFPMFLWWGEEMIQFYNDAYRPSLGIDGKHPGALGQHAKECWPEIWEIIYPLIQHVRTTRGSFFREDQLVPIFRNNKIEDVYWTFSYSPVIGPQGDIDGILVVCTETTKKVEAYVDIKVANKKFEQAEQNLRNLIYKAPVAMCVLKGPNNIVEIANERMFELWGKPSEQIINKSIFEGLPEVKNQGFEALLGKVFNTGETVTAYSLPVKLPRNNQIETVYLDFVYEAFRDNNGIIAGVMAVAIDVTFQLLARKQLEESEQRYKTLITESTVAIALYIGRELRIQYVNEIMTGYWGKDLSVIDKTLEQAVPELKGQPFLDLLDKVYTTGEAYIGTEEQAQLSRDGRLRIFYFNFVYKALRDSDGKIYGIHHIAMDITEQVQARKLIEQSEANLRNIILQAPVAMCIIHASLHTFELVNQKMVELLGKKREEIINNSLYEAFPTLVKEGLIEKINLVYATGESYFGNDLPFLLPRNGKIETVYISFVYAALKNIDEEVTGILVTASDVTEQVKARFEIEEIVAERTYALAELNKDLQRSNNQLEQFAYIASHDLQEPARKISTFADMLQKSIGDVDDRSKKYLNKIEASSERMLTLIRDVLTFSQLAKEDRTFQRIDLNEVLVQITNDFELLIDDKQAVIVNDRLPVIEGIAVQINQLFTNLISNSLKFNAKDRPVKIRIEAKLLSENEVLENSALHPKGTYYRISFQDNGIGFDQEYSKQIFDIFQRLHGKSEYSGTGIGLAMCKKIAQNHRGDIYAKSTAGKGATFHVILPKNQL